MNCKLIQFQSTSQNSKAIWRHSVLTIQRLMSHKLIQRSEIKETLHEIRIIVFSSSSLPFKEVSLPLPLFLLSKAKKIILHTQKKKSFSLLRPLSLLPPPCSNPKFRSFFAFVLTLKSRPWNPGSRIQWR